MEPHWNLIGSIALLKANAMQSLVSNVIGLYMVWQNKTLQCTVYSLNFLIGRKHQLRFCKFCQINGNDITGLLEPQPEPSSPTIRRAFRERLRPAKVLPSHSVFGAKRLFWGDSCRLCSFGELTARRLNDGFWQNATVKREWHQEMSTYLTSDSKCSSWLVFFSPRR